MHWHDYRLSSKPALTGHGEEKAKYVILSTVPARFCIVSFIDLDGLQHSTKVRAESLFEAAILAIQAFKEQDCAPGSASTLEVEIPRPSVKHTVPVRKVHEWLDSNCKSPSEKLTKERLKKLMVS
jgi:hypothetical protein